jgi:hypothetical protein
MTSTWSAVVNVMSVERLVETKVLEVVVSPGVEVVSSVAANVSAADEPPPQSSPQTAATLNIQRAVIRGLIMILTSII